MFIYILFNDAVSSSIHITSTSKKINEWLTGKDMEGNGPGLIWGTIPALVFRDWDKPQ